MKFAYDPNRQDLRSLDQIAKLDVADSGFASAPKSGCMEVTLKGVLRLLEEHGSRFVCLRGPPGSAKTAVAKNVAMSLERERRLSASFFFDKGSQWTGTSLLNVFADYARCSTSGAQSAVPLRRSQGCSQYSVHSSISLPLSNSTP